MGSSPGWKSRARGKTGPSGIGIAHYSWHLQNVHLVPMTWEDEVRLLKRELDRALSRSSRRSTGTGICPADRHCQPG